MTLALVSPRADLRTEMSQTLLQVRIRSHPGLEGSGPPGGQPSTAGSGQKAKQTHRGQEAPGLQESKHAASSCGMLLSPTFPRAHPWKTSLGAWPVFRQLVGECGWRKGRGRSRPMPAETSSCVLASQLLLRALLGTTPLPPSVAYAPHWATGLAVCVWCQEGAMEIKISHNQCWQSVPRKSSTILHAYCPRLAVPPGSLGDPGRLSVFFYC